MKIAIMSVFLAVATCAAAQAAQDSQPTKEQIELTKKFVGDKNLNNQSAPDLLKHPKPNDAMCWFADENKWYPFNSEVCWHNNMWRCGSHGQWYAIGRTC